MTSVHNWVHNSCVASKKKSGPTKGRKRVHRWPAIQSVTMSVEAKAWIAKEAVRRGVYETELARSLFSLGLAAYRNTPEGKTSQPISLE